MNIGHVIVDDLIPAVVDITKRLQGILAGVTVKIGAPDKIPEESQRVSGLLKQQQQLPRCCDCPAIHV